MKKGLNWYKTEMMKDTREYTNAELMKMLEEEFQIPVIITTWIEKEENLSHEGDAWVYGDA